MTELNISNNNSGKYKLEVIWDSSVYTRELESGHLPGLYYLVLWKGYLAEKNTWELASVVQYLRKLISSFHKKYLDKLTTTSFAINTTSSMARLIVRPTVKPIEPPKQKRRRLANSTNKWAKENIAAFDFYCIFGQIRITSTLNILNYIARDCTWLYVTSNRPSSKLLSFDFQSLDFFGFLSLSHKALVFFLELPLGQEIFHQQSSINISLSIIIDWSLSGFPP